MTQFEERQRGTVTEWSREDGHGEIELIDGRRVWAHYAVVESTPGAFRSLEIGSTVSVAIERADQDGYNWRATSIRGE